MKTTDVGKEMEVKKNVARHGARARQLTRVEEVRRKKLGGYQNMQKLDTRKSPKKATWRIDVGKVREKPYLVPYLWYLLYKTLHTKDKVSIMGQILGMQ